MGSIFDINAEYLDIIRELEDNGGELTEEIIERLHVNKNELETKLDNYRLFIAELDAQANALTEEAKRLVTRAKVKQAVIERLNGLIKLAVYTYGEVTKTGSKTYESKAAKYTFVYTKPVIVNEARITLDNASLKPFIRGNFSFHVPADQINEVLDFLTKAEIAVDTSLTVNKKELATALKANKVIDGARLDEEEGYVRIN